MVAGEVGVRLDAVADQHVVGLAWRWRSKCSGQALGGAADDDGLHAGADGAADGRLGDAVGLQHVALAFGGAAAVAAHGRDEEGLGAEVPEVLDGRAEDGDDVGDAAAAGGDGHALPRPQRPLQLQAAQLGVDRRGDIRQPGSLEDLANAEDLRKHRHQRKPGSAGFAIIRFCCERLGATAGLSSSADASLHHTAGQASSGTRRSPARLARITLPEAEPFVKRAQGASAARQRIATCFYAGRNGLVRENRLTGDDFRQSADGRKAGVRWRRLVATIAKGAGPV